jgi:hypothetical protein
MISRLRKPGNASASRQERPAVAGSIEKLDAVIRYVETTHPEQT